MPSIFLDCDGVLSNFREAVMRLGSVPAMGLDADSNHLLKDNMYKRIEEAGESFWKEMPLMPDFEKMWAYFKKYRPTLLTSPGKFTYMKSGRLKWIAKNIPGTPCFFEDEKWYYAHNDDDLLIDDDPMNIEPWIAKGGSAILHKDYATTIAEFEKLMAKPYMRVSLASHLRDVVALLSINNLKEYLNKAQGVLPSSSQLKSIIIKEILDRSNLKDEDIRRTYQKLKAIIKGYAPASREPFQITILQPLQAFFDLTDRFDPSIMNDTIRKYKEILRRPEQELFETKKLVKDISKIPFPKVLG